jgi:hypothetical protein
LISLDTFLAGSAQSNQLSPFIRFSELMRGRIFLSSPPTSLDAHSQSALDLPFPVTPLLPRSLLTGCLDSKAASAHRRPRPWHLAVQTISGGIGISTDCPSPTAFALGLGPTNPERINLPQETLDIRRARFSRAFRYSCRHSHFRPLQPSSRSTFTADGTLPYHCTRPEGLSTIRSFGTRLEPRWIFGAESLDQ